MRPLQVLKLARSGGVVVRPRELRAQARKVRVEEYFYGYRKASGAGGPAAAALPAIGTRALRGLGGCCSAAHSG